MGPGTFFYPPCNSAVDGWPLFLAARQWRRHGAIQIHLDRVGANELKELSRVDVPLFRRFLEPFRRQPRVGGHALAVPIHLAEEKLGLAIALVGGHLKPCCRFRQVLRHTESVTAHHPERDLGGDVAAPGGFLQALFVFWRNSARRHNPRRR